MARTCRWCGRTYEDSIYWGCCSEKCYLESEGRDPASQAQEALSEMRANLAKERKRREREHAEFEATLKREREDREQERIRDEERREVARKRDPKNWYGNEWAEHLSEHPEDAFLCDWGKLRGADCALLFSVHPEFAEKVVDWQSRMNGDDWEVLLCNQPRFADSCDWQSLNGANICNLLEERPQFADKCDFDLLEPTEWALLLQQQPQFADKCTVWDDIDAEDWMELLKMQPSFVDKCNWTKFAENETETCSSTVALQSILEAHPDLIDKCDLSILSVDSWAHLLVTCPQFADRFAEWDSLDADQRVLLLKDHPQFADKFKDLDCLSLVDWRHLIEKQPQFIKKCNISDRFDWSYWVRLAPLSQETADSCVWTSFLGCCEGKEALSRLLKEHPELEQKKDAEFSFLRQYVDVDRFPGLFGQDAWLAAAKNRPRIAWAACKAVFRGSLDINLKEWFKAFPFLVLQFEFDWREAREKPHIKTACSNVLPIIVHQSELISFLPYLKQMGENFFEGVRDYEWEYLLAVDPSLVRWHPNRDNMKIDWVAVVRADATALSDCDSKRFTVDDWLSILEKQPSLFDECDKVDRFTAEQWAKLLGDQPQLINVCPITKFSDTELSEFFEVVKERCQSDVTSSSREKLFLLIDALLSKTIVFTVENWVEIVERCPAIYDKYCRSIKFTSDQWARIVRSHPEMYEKCCTEIDFSPTHWGQILSTNCGDKKLIKFFNPRKFSSEDWVDFLIAFDGLDSERKQFNSKVRWGDLSAVPVEKWIKLVLKNEEYVSMLNWKKFKASPDAWKGLSTKDWLTLISRWKGASAYLNSDTFNWSALTAEEWVRLLWDFPQFKEKCDVSKVDWSGLKRMDMLRALCFCPEGIVAYYHDWESISPRQWKELVEYQPILKSYMAKYDKGNKNTKVGCQLGCLGKLLKFAFWCTVIWYGLSIGVSFVDCSKFETPEKARVVLNRMSNDGMKVREWVLGLIVKVQDTKEDKSEN